MNTVEVSKATGPTLDWLVAKCELVETEHINDGITRCLLRLTPFTGRYSPSTEWSQGGPIIERERIIHDFYDNYPSDLNDVVHARLSKAKLIPGHRARCWYAEAKGPTVLIASLRCYVKSKFGEIGEVPEELK